MDGFFQVIQADVTTQIMLGSDESTIQSLYNVSTIPMIQVFPYGLKDFRRPLTIPTNATGQLMHVYQSGKTMKQVHDVFLQFLPQNEVKQLSSSDVEDFIRSDPAKAQALLVTSKATIPPMLTKLSLDFSTGVKFGTIRSTHQASLDKLRDLTKIEVQTFPKLLVRGVGGVYSEYSGALTLGAISAGLQAINPGVIVPELTSKEVLEDSCTSKGGICVVALLPGNFDKHLEVFKLSASRRFSSGDTAAQAPLTNFAWANVDRQDDFVTGFGVDMFPAVIAMNPRKKLYSAMRGTFDVLQIRGFILNVLQGREALTKMEKLPALEKIGPSMSAAKMSEMMGGTRKPEL
eukprot:TRINITY_DN4505_c0_g1_i3.p1 TRINITY_DN4505_c0_g1~~TRINITY_DN4505_c0_g1_i3.p1  ORF type:complete len:347 (-),score=101.11 TRINITY_DN4505_c0_g1_i3:295-1335(-)